MPDVRTTVTRDQKPALTRLVRSLPGLLAGRVQDERRVAEGFRSRVGHTLLSLIAPNFEELSRGQPGADGTRWAPLKKETIAGRRLSADSRRDLRRQAGVTPQHRWGPGDKKGLLTHDQLRLWRRIFARYRSKFMMRGDHTEGQAASHAAAIAWIVVKKAGGKTKLEVYGNRTVQILVDSGRGAGSLQAGYLVEDGPHAEYQRPSGKGAADQVFESSVPGETVVGTNVGYMGAHHRGYKRKGLPERRLWPAEFPAAWWQEILGHAIGGLVRIAQLFGGTG